MGTKQIKSGGARKYGRNKAACLNYRNLQQRERNKGKRLRKHISRFRNDQSAIDALTKLPKGFQTS